MKLSNDAARNSDSYDNRNEIRAPFLNRHMDFPFPEASVRLPLSSPMRYRLDESSSIAVGKYFVRESNLVCPSLPEAISTSFLSVANINSPDAKCGSAEILASTSLFQTRLPSMRLNASIEPAAPTETMFPFYIPSVTRDALDIGTLQFVTPVSL